MPALSDARRQELLDRLSARLVAWKLREPALVLLAMHTPVSFLGSQLLFAAQPFVASLTGDALARDLALLVEDPENLEALVQRLEHAPV